MSKGIMAIVTAISIVGMLALGLMWRLSERRGAHLAELNRAQVSNLVTITRHKNEAEQELKKVRLIAETAPLDLVSEWAQSMAARGISAQTLGLETRSGKVSEVYGVGETFTEYFTLECCEGERFRALSGQPVPIEGLLLDLIVVPDGEVEDDKCWLVLSSIRK